MDEGAVLAQEGEFVTLADGQQYEVKFNMRALRDLERKYGSLTLYTLAQAGASETHGMLDAMLDGLAYGLRHYGATKFGSPEGMVDLVALGRTPEYIRAITRAMNTGLTGSPTNADDQADEGWSDLPGEVRLWLVSNSEVHKDIEAYVKRHMPADDDDQSKEDGEEPGNSPGVTGTGS